MIIIRVKGCNNGDWYVNEETENNNNNTAPASVTLEEPPARISCRTDIGRQEVGKQTRFSAIKGRPPMAKTSLSAFAAAISPNVPGSSTTGVMKSTVRIPMRSSSIRQSAASSPWLHEVRSLSPTGGSAFKTSSSSAGPILAAQPLVRASSVKRIRLTSSPKKHPQTNALHSLME